MARPTRVGKDPINSSDITSAMLSVKPWAFAIRQYVDDIFHESTLSIALQKHDGKRGEQTMHIYSEKDSKILFVLMSVAFQACHDECASITLCIFLLKNWHLEV